MLNFILRHIFFGILIFNIIVAADLSNIPVLLDLPVMIKFRYEDHKDTILEMAKNNILLLIPHNENLQILEKEKLLFLEQFNSALCENTCINFRNTVIVDKSLKRFILTGSGTVGIVDCYQKKIDNVVCIETLCVAAHCKQEYGFLVRWILCHIKNMKNVQQILTQVCTEEDDDRTNALEQEGFKRLEQTEDEKKKKRCTFQLNFTD